MGKKRELDPNEFKLPPAAPSPLEHSAATPAPPTVSAELAPAARRFVKAKPASKRRRDEPGERLVVNLPPELVKQVRVRCAEEGCSLSHATGEALAHWLRSRKGHVA